MHPRSAEEDGLDAGERLHRIGKGRPAERLAALVPVEDVIHQGGVARLFKVDAADVMAPHQEAGRPADPARGLHRRDRDADPAAVAIEMGAERPRLAEGPQDLDGVMAPVDPRRRGLEVSLGDVRGGTEDGGVVSDSGFSGDVAVDGVVGRAFQDRGVLHGVLGMGGQ